MVCRADFQAQSARLRRLRSGPRKTHVCRHAHPVTRQALANPSARPAWTQSPPAPALSAYAYEKAISFVLANEVRAMEGFNPRPDPAELLPGADAT